MLSLCGTAPAHAALSFGSGKKELDYENVAKDITALMESDPDKGPTLVRLAWHSSGTYDKMTQTGGSGTGTIRFKEELAHGGNAGLSNAVNWMEPIHAKYASQGLSYADLYTLAGVVAIRNMGGPAIPFNAGRVDAMDPSAVTPDGRLPNADVGEPGVDKSDGDHLRDIFYRMGFGDQEIVALSGAHALGRCHADYSGYVGPWSGTPTLFSNAYFQLLLKAQWEYDDRYPNYQYKDKSGTLMMLPTDLALVKDEAFLPYVQKYSKDKKAFYSDFSDAFQKLEELGTSGLKPVSY